MLNCLTCPSVSGDPEDPHGVPLRATRFRIWHTQRCQPWWAQCCPPLLHASLLHSAELCKKRCLVDIGESARFQKLHLCSCSLSWSPAIIMPKFIWLFLTGTSESISQLVETFAVFKKKPKYTQQENPPPCCGKCMTPINPNESHTCFEKGEPLRVWL